MRQMVFGKGGVFMRQMVFGDTGGRVLRDKAIDLLAVLCLAGVAPSARR